MKLISMTAFVLEQRMTSEEINASSFQQIQNHIATYYDKVYAYANFLKQPLMFGMFVQTNGGDVFFKDFIISTRGSSLVKHKSGNEILYGGKTIESLLQEKRFEFELTEKALKQIF